MKIIITESKHKNFVFKFFDKMGGAIDEDFISFFSLDGGGGLTYNQAYKYLIEWRGEKESKDLTKTLLLQNPHHIDDYGGYDFFFEVVGISNWSYVNNEEYCVNAKVKVDDLGGSVNIHGNNFNLEDALDDDDYGFEIDDEVNLGINEYFKKNITSKTGIKIIFDRIKYTSRIFDFN